MNVSRRERSLIGLALAVALLIGIPALLFPARRSSGKTPGQGQLAEQTLHRREIQRQLARARSELSDLETQRDHLLARSAPGELIREMVQAAQRAARVSGLRIADLKPLPLEKVSGLQRVPLQLSVSAAFPPAVRFLYELQRPGRGFQVEEARISSSGPRQSHMDLELRLVGYVRSEYVRSEENANASGS